MAVFVDYQFLLFISPLPLAGERTEVRGSNSAGGATRLDLPSPSPSLCKGEATQARAA